MGWPQMGPGGFFPTNPDLADTLGRTDLNFENFHLLYFLDPKFLDFQLPRLQISAFVPGALSHQHDQHINVDSTGTLSKSELKPLP